MNWIEDLEKYFDDIPTDLQSEVREFLDEYYEKKDTHSATSLDGLNDDELENLLYLDLSNKSLNTLPDRLFLCKNLKILDISYNPISFIEFSKPLKKLVFF